MAALIAFVLVLLIAGIGYLGGSVAHLRFAFGVVLPYAAIITFLAGFAFKIIRWAWAAEPFHISLTCGQQKSLPWIKSARVESPSNGFGVFLRMLFEVLLFRSLFRNTRAELHQGPRLSYAENKLLWLGAIAFHWSLLVILLRHLRFFLVPVPRLTYFLDKWDGFFQISAPAFYLTDAILVGGLLYLLARRFWDSQIRYLSLPTDYFALFLLLAVATSGILMRYFYKADLEAVKELTLGLAVLSPTVPQAVAPLFFVHLTLVSVLAAYFPLSKLMHLGAAFLTPTHLLANNSRAKRHVNPWRYAVKVHTYQEWEDEFRDKIRAAGLPLERE